MLPWTKRGLSIELDRQRRAELGERGHDPLLLEADHDREPGDSRLAHVHEVALEERLALDVDEALGLRAAHATAASRGEEHGPHRRASAAKRAVSSGGVSFTLPIPFTVPPSTTPSTITGPSCAKAAPSEAAKAAASPERKAAR